MLSLVSKGPLACSLLRAVMSHHHSYSIVVQNRPPASEFLDINQQQKIPSH
jgi:hypothetical protein